MTQDIARLRELSKRAHERLGGVSIDRMGGDNFAVTLCSHFDNPDQEEDDNGWSEDATAGCDETLQAIRAHYQPVFDALLAQLEAASARNEELVQQNRQLVEAYGARIATQDVALKRAADEFSLIKMRLRDSQAERALGAAICGEKDARTALARVGESGL